jgi:integrase
LTQATTTLTRADVHKVSEGHAARTLIRLEQDVFPWIGAEPIGELRKAEWEEFDLDAGEWRIPAACMKRSRQDKANGVPHQVPLPTQALEILRDLHPLTVHGRFVFRSVRTGERPMSDNAVLSALRRMGFPKDEMTGHGFLAMACTMLAERLGVDEAVIEAQLAHAVSGALGRAHNRTQFAEQRRSKCKRGWAISTRCARARK